MSGFLQLIFEGEFIAAVAFLLVAMFSIIMHELGHGYVATWCGDVTPRLYKRLNLNPVNHFDPLGFCCFAFVGFGWAKPVPVNTLNFIHYRRDLFFVSVAGITVNLILAFVFCLFYNLLILAFGMVTSEALGYILLFLLYFCGFGMNINLALMVFNLLPIYPLDGSRILEAILPPGNQVIRFMRKYGSIFLIGFLAINYILASRLGFSITSWLVTQVARPINWFWGLFF